MAVAVTGVVVLYVRKAFPENSWLTVLELDGRRIARLRVDPPPAPAEDGDGARTEPSSTG